MITLIGAILMECFDKLPAAIQTLKDSNTMASDPWVAFQKELPDLKITIVFLGIGCLVKIIPCIWEILILGKILKLVKELGEDRFSEQVVKIFDKLGTMCKQMLGVTVGLNMGFAILQVMFRNVLYQINMDVTIPLVSIVLVLVVMMISKYVKETQQMKEELDMFV